MPSCSACRRKGIVSLKNISIFAGLASRKNLCVKCRCTKFRGGVTDDSSGSNGCKTFQL